MRTWLLVLVTLLMFGHWTSSSGQQAKAVIAGPEEAPTGDLIILDASQSEGQVFRWWLANSDRLFLAVEENRKVVFAAGTPQQYLFILAVASGGNGQPVSVDLAEHRVTVRGPGGAVSPDLPAGRWAFAQAAYQWTMTLVPNEKRGLARPLAENFDAQAAAIEAGVFDQLPLADAIAQINTALQTANRQTLHYVDAEHRVLSARLREVAAGVGVDCRSTQQREVDRCDGTGRREWERAWRK